MTGADPGSGMGGGWLDCKDGCGHWCGYSWFAYHNLRWSARKPSCTWFWLWTENFIKKHHL